MTELGIDLKSLENLLKDPLEKGDSSDDELDSLNKPPMAKMGPGSIGPSKKKEDKEPKKSVYEKKAQSKDIWDENEVEEGAEFDATDDPRIQPDYEIIYKQKLTSEELFLQMGNKTPATSSCEDMVVEIKLPGVEKLSEIDLNLYDKFLDCRTSQYRLGLHLPHPVNSKNGNAKWITKDSKLVVTMTMNRDFDFVNF